MINLLRLMLKSMPMVYLVFSVFFPEKEKTKRFKNDYQPINPNKSNMSFWEGLFLGFVAVFTFIICFDICGNNCCQRNLKER